MEGGEGIICCPMILKMIVTNCLKNINELKVNDNGTPSNF